MLSLSAAWVNGPNFTTLADCPNVGQKIIEDQKAYEYLDSSPSTLTAKAHRPPYGKDGDYFTKPSVNDVIEKVYSILNEADPKKFPQLF